MNHIDQIQARRRQIGKTVPQIASFIAMAPSNVYRSLSSRRDMHASTLDAIGAALARAGAPEIRGQTEVPQDPFHRAGVFNQREEPQPPATTGALKHT